jgi:hypothetical protein
VGCQTRGRSGRRSPTRVDGQATAGPRLPVATTDTKSPSRVGVTGRPQSRAAGPSLPGLAGPTGLRLPTQVAITGQASLGRRRGGRPGQAAGRAARGRAGRGGPGQAGRARRGGPGGAGRGRPRRAAGPVGPGGRTAAAGRACRAYRACRVAAAETGGGCCRRADGRHHRASGHWPAAVDARLPTPRAGRRAVGSRAEAARLRLPTPGLPTPQSPTGRRPLGCGCCRRIANNGRRSTKVGRRAEAANAGMSTPVADQRADVTGQTAAELRPPTPGCRHRSHHQADGRRAVGCPAAAARPQLPTPVAGSSGNRPPSCGCDARSPSPVTVAKSPVARRPSPVAGPRAADQHVASRARATGRGRSPRQPAP